MEKSLRCVLCGTAEWEWEADRFAYEPVEKTCRGCYTKDYLAEGSQRGPGQSVELSPTTGMDAARRRVNLARAARRQRERRRVT